MKKLTLVLATIALVATVTTSCKKNEESPKAKTVAEVMADSDFAKFRAAKSEDGMCYVGGYGDATYQFVDYGASYFDEVKDEYITVYYNGDKEPEEWMSNDDVKICLQSGYLAVSVVKNASKDWFISIGTEEENVQAFIDAANTMDLATFKAAHNDVYESAIEEMFPESLYLWIRFQIIKDILSK